MSDNSKYQRISCSVPMELVKKMKKMAQKHELSLSQVLVEALEDKLENAELEFSIGDQVVCEQCSGKRHLHRLVCSVNDILGVYLKNSIEEFTPLSLFQKVEKC